MRNAFADEITRIATENARVVLLSADIGNRLFDKFKALHPDRFFNTGIAEANTISMAAGLASCGFLPVCYTIAPFITARCFEQIKLDVSYHGMPVVIVGTGAGLAYASLGTTHHSMEDIALMRALPGMRVAAPADAMELRSCLRASFASPGPAYLRIGKKGEPVIFKEPPPFAFGHWQQTRAGMKVTLLATGNMLSSALEVADLLTLDGISPSVYSCPSIKPLDEKILRQRLASDDLIVSIEEHSIIGGFGAALAEWVIDNFPKANADLLRIGAPDSVLPSHGEQEFARECFGLTSASIKSAISRRLKNLPSFVSP